LSIWGKAAAMPLDPLDEMVESQPAQVVGHLSGAVGNAEQAGDQGTEAPVGEAAV
jgi:hypothetical protein